VQDSLRAPGRSLLRRRLKQYRSIYLMILPVLVYFLIFSFYPLILGLIQSLQKERLLGTPQFIGLKNYEALFRDRNFLQALWNSFYIGSTSLVINIMMGTILALSLNELRSRPAKAAVQTVTFLPYLFSWTVVGGVWIYVLSHNGLVNGMLDALGLERVSFFTVPAWGRPVMLFTNAWKQSGYFAVLLLASLVGIDPEVYEAAHIDGASRMQQIGRISLPMMLPTVKTLLLLGATGVLRNFDQVLIMSRPAIKDKVGSVLLFIYEQGILKMKIGLATSAAAVVLLATFLIALAVRKASRYEGSLYD